MIKFYEGNVRNSSLGTIAPAIATNVRRLARRGLQVLVKSEAAPYRADHHLDLFHIADDGTRAFRKLR
uniref:Uncharacterized protein n=1 Tax=Trichuris muris TaxID=70415 RepID=A0A5S6QSL7_TRIMR